MILRKLPKNMNSRLLQTSVCPADEGRVDLLTFSDFPQKWKLKAAVQLDGHTVAAVFLRCSPQSNVRHQRHLCPG